MKVIPHCVPKSACSCPRSGLVWEAKAAGQGERHWQGTVVQSAREMGIAPYVSQLLAALGTQATQEKRVAVPNAATSSHLPLSAFSHRELKILRLIQESHSNQDIGERLYLSLSTVKWHNQNIFSKLDVQRRTEARLHAPCS